MAESKKTVKVTLVKSPIGTNAKQRATLAGLGLKKLHQSREHLTDFILDEQGIGTCAE